MMFWSFLSLLLTFENTKQSTHHTVSATGVCGCGHPRRDWHQGWAADREEERDCKSHRERNVAQHFILCDNSQSCQSHPSVGISTIVLSLVRGNKKEWFKQLRQPGNGEGGVGFWQVSMLHSGIWLETYLGVGRLSPEILHRTCTAVRLRCQIWACFPASLIFFHPFRGFSPTWIESSCFNGYTHFMKCQD